MKKQLYLFLSIASFILLVAAEVPTKKILVSINDNKPLAEVLKLLGNPPSSHEPDFSIEGVSVETGADLVLKGMTINTKGKETEKQSAFFVCTSCHNIVRDEPSLKGVNAQARLEYVDEKGLPFLQGTSLYGVVNRTSFYNGDYEKKYGDLVKPARNDLREAIQLCAVECSQGRALEAWEMESVLAYLWTIELKFGDLEFSPKELKKINKQINKGTTSNKTITIIKSKYLQSSPATFVNPSDNIQREYSSTDTENLENGRLIYELACLYCHENKRYSTLELDKSEKSFSYLNRSVSLDEIIRHGTKPYGSRKSAYMPNFTLEKMSNQMVKDLRAYIAFASK